MFFTPLSLHDDYGFTLPSYNAREAIKNLAKLFVKQQIRAKATTLRQKLRPGIVYSAQILVMGGEESLELIGDVMKANVQVCGDIGLDNPQVKAWVRIDSDSPHGDHPLFMVRAEQDLLSRVDLFFSGFVNLAKQKGE